MMTRVLMLVSVLVSFLAAYVGGRSDGYKHGLEDGWNLAIYNCQADKRNCKLTTEPRP